VKYENLFPFVLAQLHRSNFCASCIALAVHNDLCASTHRLYPIPLWGEGSMKSLKALVILLLIAGTAWFLHDAKRDRDEATKRATEAELQAGIDGARIVNQRFSTAAALQVYEMAANAVGQATFKGTFFTSTQVSNPYTPTWGWRFR
jgi:hypothetical protein